MLGQSSGLRTDLFLRACHFSRWPQATAAGFLSSCHLRRLEVLVFFGDFGFWAALIGGAPVVWATFGALLAPSGRAKWLKLTEVLALLHYASGLALVAATTGYDELAYLARVLAMMLIWAAVYLIGQVALWWRASRRGEHGPTV